MKESKFIELLNLYVDHQISAEEAALLEAEIQSKPERRQVYRQYCQMQKACTILAENFRNQAPATSGKVIEFPQTRRRLNVVTYAAGLAAAAACLTLVFVSRERLLRADLAARPEPAVVQVAADVSTPAIRPTAARAELRPAFAGLVRDESGAGALAIAERTPFDWMTRVQLQRVPIDELKFETRPTLQPVDLRLRGGPAYRTQTEMTAFRFQR